MELMTVSKKLIILGRLAQPFAASRIDTKSGKACGKEQSMADQRGKSVVDLSA
jgi:hypothetical protein